MPADASKRLRGWRFIALNLALGAGHILVLSNVGGYTIAVPYAAGSLDGVSPSFATWATTDFLVGLALGYPVARWLEGRYGGSNVLAAAFLGYALTSWLCAISEPLWLYLPARVLQGIVGGVTLPIGQALLLGEYPKRFRLIALSVWGVFTIMPFTIGIPLGGWIAEYLGWRSLFLLNIPLSLGIAFVTVGFLSGRAYRHRVLRFDGVGYLLLAMVLFGIQTILNQGNDFDWFDSWFLTACAITVTIALPCLILWEIGERSPAIDVRLFAHRNFAVSGVLSVVGFSIIQGLLVALFAGQLQLLLGYSSSLAGWVYLVVVPLSVPLVALAHVLCEGVDARIVASLNFIGFSAVLTWIGLFDEPSDFDQILWPMLFFGFCLGMFFAPLGILGVHGLPERHLIRAAEELALLRTAAGGAGIALQGVVQFRRTPFHQLDLADHFGGRRFASLDLLGQFKDRLESSGFTSEMTTAYTWQLIRSRSALLGFNDAFLLAGFICALMAIFVWLAKSTRIEPSLKNEDAKVSLKREGMQS